MQPEELIGPKTTFKRYRKLSEDNPIILGDGQDLPAGLINPEYKQRPGNSRKCVECGKMHDTIVEDTRTGERLSEIDKCEDCLFAPIFKKAMGRLDFPISTESIL